MNVAELVESSKQLKQHIDDCKDNAVLYGVRMDRNFKKYIKHFLNVIIYTNGCFGHVIVNNYSVCRRINIFIKNYLKFYNLETGDFSCHKYYCRNKYNVIDNITMDSYDIFNTWKNVGSYRCINLNISKKDKNIENFNILNNKSVGYYNGNSIDVYDIIIFFTGEFKILDLPFNMYNCVRNLENFNNNEIKNMISGNSKHIYNRFKHNIQYCDISVVSHYLFTILENCDEKISKNINKIFNIKFLKGE